MQIFTGEPPLTRGGSWQPCSSLGNSERVAEVPNGVTKWRNCSCRSVGNAQPVTGPATSGAAWGGGELGDGKAGHASGADPGQGGEPVQTVHPAGRTTEAGTSSPNAAPPGVRDPGRVPPTGLSPRGGHRSLPATRRLSSAAQRQVPARLRSGMASLNRTCNETDPAPYPRER